MPKSFEVSLKHSQLESKRLLQMQFKHKFLAKWTKFKPMPTIHFGKNKNIQNNFGLESAKQANKQ